MNKETSATPSDELTVGEHLDRQIAHTRMRLEELYIAKAKAETIQILNVPLKFIHFIGW